VWEYTNDTKTPTERTVFISGSQQPSPTWLMRAGRTNKLKDFLIPNIFFEFGEDNKGTEEPVDNCTRLGLQTGI